MLFVSLMKIKIIKILLTPRTAAFKIVHLDNKEINDLDAGNMFYWKKRDAIKYINNSSDLQLEKEQI